MDIIQIVLLAIVTFIFAIDQFSLTETIYQPIISCTIMGAILGNLNVGMAVGGAIQLMSIGNMPVGGAQPPNWVMTSIASVVFATRGGLGVTESLAAALPFAVFGQFAVTSTFAAMSAIMAKADKAAADANPKGIAQVNYISMLILGSLFAAFAVVAYVGGEPAGNFLNSLAKDPNFSWIMGGLSVAGGMMRFVGFAILLKIMLANDMWGIYFAGFAAALILGNVSATSGATLVLVAFIGLAIAIYDYNINVKLSEKSSGGFSDGI